VGDCSGRTALTYYNGARAAYRDDTDKLPKLYAKTVTHTNSDPCAIDDGQRSAGPTFAARSTSTASDSAAAICGRDGSIPTLDGRHPWLALKHVALNSLRAKLCRRAQ
jgi:hypothetical protein